MQNADDDLLAGGRREREGVSAEMCLSRATVRDCLGRVDFAGGGPPPPPLSCLLPAVPFDFV